MLHRFSFRNGEVSYANRFLRSSPYTEGVENGKIRYSAFATDPCRSLFKRLATVFAPPDQAPIANANVNIIRLAGTFIAMTETPIPVQFDPRVCELLLASSLLRKEDKSFLRTGGEMAPSRRDLRGAEAVDQ